MARVFCLANGNLNGRTIRLIADALATNGAVEPDLYTTASVTPWPEEREAPHRLPVATVSWEEAARRIVAADAFLFPLNWLGATQQLIGAARRAGVPSLGLLCDIGYDAHRIDPSKADSIPDWIGVADPISRDLVLAAGARPAQLLKLGSPYLDSMGKPVSPPLAGRRRIGVLGSLDYRRRGLPGKRSSEASMQERILAVLEESGAVEVALREHPRAGSTDTVSTMREYIAEVHGVVGTYSTGLIVARMLGRHACSFQPERALRLREDALRAWDVPILATDAALKAWVDTVVEGRSPPPVKGRRYETGRSCAAIAACIARLAVSDHRWSAAVSKGR
ncbi:MAG: hypothetical protein AAGE01_07885 [Pseudomonadota bacterium]